MRALLLIGGLIAFPPLLFMAWIAFTISRYEAREIILPTSSLGQLPADTIRLLSWNIGYAGLGEEMDFFFDGGKQVRPSPENSMAFLEGITQYINGQEETDIFLLQEVDEGSARSYYQNQPSLIGGIFPDYSVSFALNYDVAFVPVPLRNPMGRVRSGLLTMSRAQSVESIRLSLPGRFGWPKQWFMPYRCLLVTRFNLVNGKQLVVVNIHNSVFAEGEAHRVRQVAFLYEFMMNEYLAGHYVLAGGDWNQSPSGFQPEQLVNGDIGFRVLKALDESMFDDWSLAWDPGIPSCRALNVPYVRGETLATIIDYFLCSPNIEVLETRTTDLTFKYSDHQPVHLTIRLKAPKA